MATKILRAGTLITGTGTVLEDTTVIVEDGHIEDVTQDGTFGNERLEFSDKIIMPGLIDAHTHLNYTGHIENYRSQELPLDEYVTLRSAEQARKGLCAGVTTVADTAARGTTTFALRNAIADGVTFGPRIKACGNMLAISGGRATNGQVGTNILEVDGADDARKKARQLLMYHGADLIKLAATGALSSPHTGARDPQLTVAEMRAATEEAHKYGRPVHAHCYGEAGINNALEAGVDVIVHGQSLTDEHISTMREDDRILVPTLATNRKFENKEFDDYETDRKRPESSGGLRAEAEPNFKRALEEGITVAAGTDCGMPYVPHGTNPIELVYYVDWGMKEGEAIVAGTRNAARALHLEDELGTIEPGKHADLLVLDENPLSDISVLADSSTINRIMLDGDFIEDRCGLFNNGAVSES